MKPYCSSQTKLSFKNHMLQINKSIVLCIIDAGMFGNCYVYYYKDYTVYRTNAYQSCGFSSTFTCNFQHEEKASWSDTPYSSIQDYDFKQIESQLNMIKEEFSCLYNKTNDDNVPHEQMERHFDPIHARSTTLSSSIHELAKKIETLTEYNTYAATVEWERGNATSEYED